MKILFIGDSLTYGYGVDHNKCWVYLLSKNKYIDTVNRGINGDTTAGMLSRSYEDIISFRPTYVVIMGGTNDILSGSSHEYVEENINLLAKEAQSLGSSPIIAIQPPIIPSIAENLWSKGVDYYKVNEEIACYRNEIISYALKNNIRYIDFFSNFQSFIEKDKAADYYIDGLHLNTEGNIIMYDIASKVLFT